MGGTLAESSRYHTAAQFILKTVGKVMNVDGGGGQALVSKAGRLHSLPSL